MRAIAIAVLVLLSARSANADTVYEFGAHCRAASLGSCFALIEERLERLEARDQRQRFCVPRAWGASMFASVRYPVSVLDHVRLAMSAARFGHAGSDADELLLEIMGRVYPCE
ncbi:MAG TPA: hypothetical protein VEA77_01155 [Hyphomicrobium sp.]|nr:hypothetical protein [Hyphomicrobium sp.]